VQNSLKYQCGITVPVDRLEGCLDGKKEKNIVVRELLEMVSKKKNEYPKRVIAEAVFQVLNSPYEEAALDAARCIVAACAVGGSVEDAPDKKADIMRMLGGEVAKKRQKSLKLENECGMTDPVREG